MYEKLIAVLRHCGNENVPCEGCPVHDECGYFDIGAARNMREAADAIGELSMKLHGDEAAIAGMKREIERMVVAGKPRWIPATEEPPRKVGDDDYNGYLVYANGYYEVADYTIDKLDNVPYFHVNGEYETDVTHWMPLPPAPEPPKEEDKCT